MWDEEDGFYYDLLRLPDGSCDTAQGRSLVGLLPLCATTIVEASTRDRIPGVIRRSASGYAGYPNSHGPSTPRGRDTSVWRSAGLWHSSTPNGSAGSLPRCLTKTNS